MQDLRDGAYILPLERIRDYEIIEWVDVRLAEMEALTPPIEQLLARLSDSWGEAGEPGDLHEIHHTCRLIRDHLTQIINYEESVRFVNVSKDFDARVNLLRDCIGSQADKLATLPEKLDDILSTAIELDEKYGDDIEPRVIHETITMDLPPNWEKQFSRESRKAIRLLEGRDELAPSISNIFGKLFAYGIVVAILIWVFY